MAREKKRGLKELLRAFSRNIWQVPLNDMVRGRFYLFLVLKVLAAALRGFNRDQCALRASALTFYSLLSIVPVVAMTFGIAKGFGLEENLHKMLIRQTESSTIAAPVATPFPKALAPRAADTSSTQTMGATAKGRREDQQWRDVTLIEEVAPGQTEAIRYIVEKGDVFLKSMGSGLFAGVSTAVLFWIVIRLLVNIEESFNAIWKVTKGRPFARRISDYLSMTLIGSVLLVVAGSLTVYITANIGEMAKHIALLGDLAHLLVRLIPYAAVWLLFTFLYMLMPNRRVSFKAGIIAGVVAGTVYQVIQWAYVRFQIGVGHYSAVFGSVAALPLFLVWLQMSWLVVLLGAEISFAVDDPETYEPKREYSQASLRYRRLLALRVAELCVKRFVKGEPPVTSLELSHAMGAPLPLVSDALARLVQSGILSQVRRSTDGEDCYQPGRSARLLTVVNVVEAIDRLGNDKDHIINDGEFDALAPRLDRISQVAASSPDNTVLENL